MRVMTFKAKPKTIFGISMCLLGVLVMILTFFGNHSAKPVTKTSAEISGETEKDRADFLKSFGWEFESRYSQKEVKIPMYFNDVYKNYNEIHTSQGFNLEDYKGKKATLYSYKINNYKGHEKDEFIYADILVYNGKIIGGDICSTNAENGFMHGFKYAKT